MSREEVDYLITKVHNAKAAFEMADHFEALVQGLNYYAEQLKTIKIEWHSPEGEEYAYRYHPGVDLKDNQFFVDLLRRFFMDLHNYYEEKGEKIS